MSSASLAIFGSYELPPTIATKRDLALLVSELERIDNEMTSASVQNHQGDQQGDQQGVYIPDQVQEFLNINEFGLDNTNDRTELIAQLRLLKRQAPVIHMSFAVEADSSSLGSIVSWFRDSIHPQSIIAVGFQPSLVAGAYVRTPNHIYDLSLRSAFKKGREKLLEELESISGNK